MGADDRANIIDYDLLNAKALAYHVCHSLSVLQAVAMADEDSKAAGINRRLGHLVHQGLEGCLSAPRLVNINKAPLVVYMEHRLDVEHGAHYGGGGGDASSPLEEVEIVHSKLMAQVELVILYPVPRRKTVSAHPGPLEAEAPALRCTGPR